MQTVSDSFKKAIKSDNREIHGYVEVVYDEKNGEYSATQLPSVSVLSKQDGSDLTDTNKIIKNYATLENNYFLLDGSFILANKNILYESGGYISNNTFENIDDKRITLVSSQTGYVTTKGFTIFFKDNIPFDFNITIITNYGETEDEDESITINVRNNTRRNYQKIFNNEVSIKKFILTILSIEHQDRRIRIPEISFSLSDLYEGEELVNFDVTEEIDLLLESAPINTCTINLNNYPDENGYYKFDPINPTGIVSYLTENTLIKPYIGALTEENGIEYVKMGTFYLKDWSSDSDGNVIFNGQSMMGIIQGLEIKSDGTMFSAYKTNTEMNTSLNNIYGFNFKIAPTTNKPYGGGVLQDTNLLNYLLMLLILRVVYVENNITYKRFLHITRNNVFSEDVLNENSIDSISRNMQFSDPNYEHVKAIKSVIMNNYLDWANDDTTTPTKIVSGDYILSKTTEYILIPLPRFVRVSNSSFSYISTSGGTATLIDKNYFLIYIRLNGSVGEKITVTYTGEVYNDKPYYKYEWNDGKTDGDTITLDVYKYDNYSSASFIEVLKSIANYYLTMIPKYKVTVKTIGDPSLEVGDTISIQTRYQDTNDGYKDIIITKQKFTYDGGLQCELEGRGN